MFCKHCGKEVADGAKFCAACGQPTGEAPRTASGTGLPPIADSFIAQLKALVNPTEGIGLAAKCPDFTGVIGIGLYYLIYVFYTTVSAYQNDLGDFIGFGGMFGISCAMGAIYLALLCIAYFGVCFVAQGGMPNVVACVNSIGFALLPAICAMVLNFGFGFVWDPLASFLTTIGSIFLYLILYISVQKMENQPARSYLWIFCIAIAFAVVLANFINNEIYTAYLNSCMRSSWW